MSISHQYVKELDRATVKELERSSYNSRLPLCCLPIPPEILSMDGTEWLHCVEAVKTSNKCHQSFLRIRVITNAFRGVTVTVPMVGKTMHLKYLDLRFQIRNSDRVLITFPELYVGGSPHNHKEIYLCANDFKLYDETTKE